MGSMESRRGRGAVSGIEVRHFRRFFHSVLMYAVKSSSVVNCLLLTGF